MPYGCSVCLLRLYAIVPQTHSLVCAGLAELLDEGRELAVGRRNRHHRRYIHLQCRTSPTYLVPGVNLQEENQMSLHTLANCTMPDARTMSGLANSTVSPEALAAIKAIIPQTLGADLLGTLFGLVCVVLPWVVVFC